LKDKDCTVKEDGKADLKDLEDDFAEFKAFNEKEYSTLTYGMNQWERLRFMLTDVNGKFPDSS